jgi:hypothetical protein
MPNLETARGHGASVAASSPNLPPAERLSQVLTMMHQQRMDGMRMSIDLPHAAAFHASHAKWRLITGSNRSGKTMATAKEYTFFARGCDPYDKYQTTGANGLVVGKDADHLAMMWRKISEEGAFYMVRDEFTHLWRAVRIHPSDPTRLDDYDEAYREKWKPGPPLAPWKGKNSCVSKISWDDAGKGIPRVVTYNTGNRILWRSSEGKASQGDHLHFFYVDEELVNDQHFEEGNRGLVGLNEPEKWLPKGIWSATPQTSNVKLLGLLEQAESGAPHVDMFFFSIDDNPFVPQSEKVAFFNSMDENEREFRYYGKPDAKGRLVYSMYHPQGIHGCEPSDVPVDATSYLFVDPSNEATGTVMLKVDAQEKHRWVYDGFIIKLRKGATVQDWAREVADRSGGVIYQAAVMDNQMGQQRHVGGGPTVADLWWDALMRAGVKVVEYGGLQASGFYPGCNDVAARQLTLQNWLLPREDGDWKGTPLLKVVRGCFPELDKQILHARMISSKPNRRVKRTEKRAELVEDALDALEYGAAFDPGYRPASLRTENHSTDIYSLYLKTTKSYDRGAVCVLG